MERKELSMNNGNGNAYTEGRATRAYPSGNATLGQAPAQQKITFDPPRVPVILKPIQVPTRTVPGRDGDQYKWEFEGNQVAYFDPDVHEEICACLRIAECNEVAITKHVRKGQPPRYEVQPVRDETQPTTHAELVNRRVQEVKFTNRVQEVKTSLPPAPPPAPAPRSAPRPSRVWPTEEAAERETAELSPMAKAIVEALLACQEVHAIANANGIKYTPSTDNINALAITIYIQGAKR
jgi:hypothetical protein